MMKFKNSQFIDLKHLYYVVYPFILLKDIIGSYLVESNETTLKIYKNYAHILIGSSRDAINEKMRLWWKREEELSRQLKFHYERYKEIHQDHKREIIAVRKQIMVIINSEISLRHLLSQVNDSCTKEKVDSLIKSDLNFITHLSEKCGVLSKEFLETYKKNGEKICKMTISAKSKI